MWEIFTYGGGTYLPEVFTALKQFFGSGEFNSLARLAGAISILIISSTALTLKSYNPTEWLNYLVRYALVYGALFVPKVDVAIVDRLNPNIGSPQVISEVPFGVGVFASMTSTVGDGLARLYDQFITIPGDQKYEQYGMLFGSTLVVNTFDTRFPDADFAQNMNQFVQNCALPMVARGRISMSQMDVAPDIWAVFKNNVPVNRFVVYRENGTEDIIACSDSATKLEDLMTAQTDSGINTLAGGMFPGLDRTQATTIVAASIGSSMQELMKVSSSSSDTIKQAMMINAVRDAMSNPPAGTDTASLAVAYAQASAEATQHMNYRVAGAIAAENIPLLRTVIECLLYALFPVVGIMMLLPFGISALGHYLRFLVWINLWPLLYAILNSVMFWYAQAQSSSAAVLPDSSVGYTIYNAMNLYSVNTKVTDYAGYLVASIPVLAYAMVQAGAAAGASLVSSMMAPAMSAAAAAGSAAAMGNINQGNMSADNVSHHNTGSWKYDTEAIRKSGMMAYRDNHGNIQKIHASGEQSLDQSDRKMNAFTDMKATEAFRSVLSAKHDEAHNLVATRKHELDRAVQAANKEHSSQEVADATDLGFKQAGNRKMGADNNYTRTDGFTTNVNAGASAGVDASGKLTQTSENEHGKGNITRGGSSGFNAGWGTTEQHRDDKSNTANSGYGSNTEFSDANSIRESKKHAFGGSLEDVRRTSEALAVATANEERLARELAIANEKGFTISNNDMTAFYNNLDGSDKTAFNAANSGTKQEQILRKGMEGFIDSQLNHTDGGRVDSFFNEHKQQLEENQRRATQGYAPATADVRNWGRENINKHAPAPETVAAKKQGFRDGLKTTQEAARATHDKTRHIVENNTSYADKVLNAGKAIKDIFK